MSRVDDIVSCDALVKHAGGLIEAGGAGEDDGDLSGNSEEGKSEDYGAEECL